MLISSYLPHYFGSLNGSLLNRALFPPPFRPSDSRIKCALMHLYWYFIVSDVFVSDGGRVAV